MASFLVEPDDVEDDGCDRGCELGVRPVLVKR